MKDQFSMIKCWLPPNNDVRGDDMQRTLLKTLQWPRPQAVDYIAAILLCVSQLANLIPACGLYWFILFHINTCFDTWQKLSQSCDSRLAWQAFKLRTDSTSFALARFSWCFLWGCTVSTVYTYNLLWYRIIDMYIYFIYIRCIYI